VTLTARPPSTLRLTAGTAPTLSEHLHLHGPLPEPGLALIDAIDRAGLRGRGGGAFPAARKMDAVAASRRSAVVVANAAEGEPMSAKDRWLMAHAPHLVLDGAVLAAGAVRADEVVLCVRGDALKAQEAARLAIAEREAAGMLPVVVHLVATPAVYLAGEESALVNFLNGGPPRPTFVPPRPYERGVSRRPTLVQNVETLAHVALIARHGASWFRAAGTAADPGTALVTVSGAVARPGVHEVDLGDPLREALAAAGGATEPVRGALVGGYFGAWTGPTGRPAPSLGSGAIAILPESACPVAETAGVAAYLAREAAGQCGPCTNGLGAVATALAHIANGTAGPTVMHDLERWSAIVPGRGACRHPDGAIGFVASALTVFADDFAQHLRTGPCARCPRPPVLPTPR
jgi:NADH:ubiquinone oxidoreductase subunit F (NADH-binding)